MSEMGRSEQEGQNFNGESFDEVGPGDVLEPSAEEPSKEELIRLAEEYSPEARQLGKLLATVRRWAQSAGGEEVDEAINRAAWAHGGAMLSATLALEHELPLDDERNAAWREVASEEIEVIRQMLPDFLLDDFYQE